MISRGPSQPLPFCGWRIKQILNEQIDIEDGNKLNLEKKQ